MYDEVVSAYDQPIKFTVGFAGSGKSTKLAQTANDNTLVMTPTHMAASVLKGKGVKNVYTIHSVLKLVPTINQEFRQGQRMETLKKIGDTDLSTIKEVIIDEYSMISTRILNLLLDVLPGHCTVHLFGDPYQLPPVDGEPIDYSDYTEDIEELTTQHRAEAPEVVETFMRFMRYIRGDGEMNLKLNPAIKHGSLANFNPLTDRCLAYTNNEVIRLNNQIASYLNLSENIAPGDAILINGIDAEFRDDISSADFIYPSCVSKGSLMQEDNLRLAMQKASNDIDCFGTDLSEYGECDVYIDGEFYSVYYDLKHYATSKKLKRQVEIWQQQLIQEHRLADDINLATWCKENRSAKYVKERGRAWSDYLSHKNYVFDMRRPYATTVHKSQGKEFSTVYIAQDDIKKSIRNGYYLQYARLMYVALSRAVHKVVIV